MLIFVLMQMLKETFSNRIGECMSLIKIEKEACEGEVSKTIIEIDTNKMTASEKVFFGGLIGLMILCLIF